MIIQVHDELILETPQEVLEETKSLVCEVMESAYPLQVPLKVDLKVGRNWKEMEPTES
jgi:DNA polymerase-1